MCNVERVKQAIEVMRRAEAADMIRMRFYQSDRFGYKVYRTLSGHYMVAPTEETLHACGNKACFAGYLAASPEWKASGGTVDPDLGAPIYGGFDGSRAIECWLGISLDLADNFVYGGRMGLADGYAFSPFYGKPWGEVRAGDVIQKLQELLPPDDNIISLDHTAIR